jgi:hypothetical protein
MSSMNIKYCLQFYVFILMEAQTIDVIMDQYKLHWFVFFFVGILIFLLQFVQLQIIVGQTLQSESWYQTFKGSAPTPVDHGRCQKFQENTYR